MKQTIMMISFVLLIAGLSLYFTWHYKFRTHITQDIEACKNGWTIDTYVWRKGKIIASRFGSLANDCRAVNEIAELKTRDSLWAVEKIKEHKSIAP